DMLDFAFDVRPTSRLSCQITVKDELDGLVVATPERQACAVIARRAVRRAKRHRPSDGYGPDEAIQTAFPRGVAVQTGLLRRFAPRNHAGAALFSRQGPSWLKIPAIRPFWRLPGGLFSM